MVIEQQQQQQQKPRLSFGNSSTPIPDTSGNINNRIENVLYRLRQVNTNLRNNKSIDQKTGMILTDLSLAVEHLALAIKEHITTKQS